MVHIKKKIFKKENLSFTASKMREPLGKAAWRCPRADQKPEGEGWIVGMSPDAASVGRNSPGRFRTG